MNELLKITLPDQLKRAMDEWKNHEVYVYGAGDVAREIAHYLNSKIKIKAFLVTDCENNPRIFENANVIKFNDITMTSKEILILAVCEKNQKEILKQLNDSHQYMVYTISDSIYSWIIGENKYKDYRKRCKNYDLKMEFDQQVNDRLGQEIQIDDSSYIHVDSTTYMARDVNIQAERGVKIFISRKAKIGKDVTIIVRDNSIVYIGENVFLQNGVSVVCLDNSYIMIGNNSMVERCGELSAFGYGILKIYDNCTFGTFVEIRVHETDLIIKEDCMCAQHVNIVAGDGHRIIDQKTKEIKNHKEPIIIEEHVWIGVGVTLLSKSKIGTGSIIGAGAIVNSFCKNNSLMVGIPAKQIRGNIAWSR